MKAFIYELFEFQKQTKHLPLRDTSSSMLTNGDSFHKIPKHVYSFECFFFPLSSTLKTQTSGTVISTCGRRHTTCGCCLESRNAMLIICVWTKTQTSRNTFYVTCCVKTVLAVAMLQMTEDWNLSLDWVIMSFDGSVVFILVFLQIFEKTIKCWCFPSSIYIISLPLLQFMGLDWS